MRRRQPQTPAAATVPAELAAGPCLEVWVGPHERPHKHAALAPPTWRLRTAGRRWSDARRDWALQHGLTDRQMFQLMPSRAPYSARHLAATGREERARELLGPMADAVLGAPGPRIPPTIDADDTEE